MIFRIASLEKNALAASEEAVLWNEQSSRAMCHHAMSTFGFRSPGFFLATFCIRNRTVVPVTSVHAAPSNLLLRKLIGRRRTSSEWPRAEPVPRVSLMNLSYPHRRGETDGSNAC